MTWIEVVSDAVKIGLGAIIAGVFAWLVARHDSKSAIQKLRFERRTKILSDVAQQYETYFRSFLKLTQHLSGIDAAEKAPFKNEADKLIRPQFLADLRAEGANLRMRLIQESVECLAGQSQLMLLGEKECVKRTGHLSRAIQDADMSYKFDGKTFDLSGLEKANVAVREERKLFYEEMRKAFDRIS